MTDEQFNKQYALLSKHIPWQFGSQEVCDALSKEVGGLSGEWFEKVVARILLTHAKGNYNIGADIKAEKTRIAQEFSTRENATDFEAMKRNSTAMGFNAELRKRNAASLWEAVENEKKGRGA